MLRRQHSPILQFSVATFIVGQFHVIVSIAFAVALLLSSPSPSYAAVIAASSMLLLLFASLFVTWVHVGVKMAVPMPISNCQFAFYWILGLPALALAEIVTSFILFRSSRIRSLHFLDPLPSHLFVDSSPITEILLQPPFTFRLTHFFKQGLDCSCPSLHWCSHCLLPLPHPPPSAHYLYYHSHHLLPGEKTALGSRRAFQINGHWAVAADPCHHLCRWPSRTIHPFITFTSIPFSFNSLPVSKSDFFSTFLLTVISTILSVILLVTQHRHIKSGGFTRCMASLGIGCPPPTLLARLAASEAGPFIHFPIDRCVSFPSSFYHSFMSLPHTSFVLLLLNY